MNLDAIGIVSADLQKSIKFYSLLGVSLASVGGSQHLEGITSSGLRLMVDSAQLMKEINPSWQKPNGVGIVLCFKMSSPLEVDKMFHKIVQAGYESVKGPWDAFWGQRYSSVLDPDGNQIDIFAQL